MEKSKKKKLAPGDKVTVESHGKSIIGIVTKIVDGVVHWKDSK